MRFPLGIGLGAIAGSLLRYYITLGLNQLLEPMLEQVLKQWTGTAFSLGTLTVNLTGAFGLGFFATWMLDKTEVSPELQLAISVGFFGAYTTFSTYELEAMALLIADDWPIALLYWAGTAVLGVLCLETGSQLAKKLFL